MNMKLLIPAAGLLVCLGGSTQAGLYEIVFEGQFDEVSDLRTTLNDPFAGTALAVEHYQAQVGDSWVYSVIYDTDTPDDNQGPIIHYSLHSPASITINGMTAPMIKPSDAYFYSMGDSQIFEFKSDVESNGTIEGRVYTSFTRTDGIDESINDGLLFTDASVFSNLEWGGLLVLDNFSFLRLSTDGASEYTVRINQIPTPSTLLMFGSAGLFVGRRRR